MGWVFCRAKGELRIYAWRWAEPTVEKEMTHLWEESPLSGLTTSEESLRSRAGVSSQEISQHTEMFCMGLHEGARNKDKGEGSDCPTLTPIKLGQVLLDWVTQVHPGSAIWEDQVWVGRFKLAMALEGHDWLVYFLPACDKVEHRWGLFREKQNY